MKYLDDFINSFGRVIQVIFRLFYHSKHKHEFTNHLIVSGYGYTEYEIWFCKWCPKVFGKQTKNFN